ncbi:hypothetical protein [Leeuwenhoekiella parthenopeia]|uniref:Uncharacterized protein n=1 Tax=Leeuwenhoekiella parthenopeia TaxID=2890320 RepID=A0ABS8GVY7_9FLAO|nr:hypothetical protein [Leeuwenhoekiella parthenopeia]MCC4214176.1 hypothetical protein [Leeuwenhoekiella parthenopeia]
MRKKLFSFTATAFIMISSFNLEAKENLEMLVRVDCWEAGEAAEDAFMDYMVQHRIIPSYEQGYQVFSAAYDSCMEASGQN